MGGSWREGGGAIPLKPYIIPKPLTNLNPYTRVEVFCFFGMQKSRDPKP